MSEPETLDAERCQRRAVLGGAVGLGIGLALWPAARAGAADPTTTRPQPGDRFVYLSGAKKGEVVRSEDLAPGDPQVLVYPMDPGTNTPRSGSRLNQVLLVRLDPEQLSEETRAHAADGVVAYSAVCTHQGCPVNMWKKDAGTLYCSCHGSQFDPKDGAKVLDGPAPRRLATLPVKIEDGLVVAAGEFSGRVGFK